MLTKTLGTFKKQPILYFKYFNWLFLYRTHFNNNNSLRQ